MAAFSTIVIACASEHRQIGLLVAKLCEERDHEVLIDLAVTVREERIEDCVSDVTHEL
jgi:hypothetical protein